MTVFQGQILRITVEGTNPSAGASQNVYHVQLLAPGTITESEALDDVVEMMDAVYGAIAPALSTAWLVNNVHVVNVSGDTVVGDTNLTDTTPGSNGSTRHPPNVALCLNLTTNFLRRRGRKFFGPTCVDIINSVGVVQTAGLNAANAAGDILDSTFEGTNGLWRFGIIPNWEEAIPFIFFTSHQVRAVVSTQRRRVPGVGI